MEYYKCSEVREQANATVETTAYKATSKLTGIKKQ